ncbi:MAG: hypothetical protein MI919_07925, partial [Holophagales bacterium]|nr:hypothetical protein [Holophagales bacterium]
MTLDSVTVSNPRLIATTGSMRGGVIYSIGDSVAVLDSRFDGLTGDAAFSLEGGAIFLDAVGKEGGAVLSLTDSTFSNFDITSSGTLEGGAIHGTNLQLDGATFEDFTLQVADKLQGGAVHIGRDGSGSSIRNSVFRRIDSQPPDVSPGGETLSYVEGGGLHVDFFTRLALSDTHFSDITMVSEGPCTGGSLMLRFSAMADRFIVENSLCHSLGSTARGGGAAFLWGGTELRDCIIRNCEARSTSSALTGSAGGLLVRGRLIERCAILDNRFIAFASDEA